eukprot:snap_masked-scaffold_6-processed-gene-9.15-mRNA-1 protein AED:1.00 eAED:1.00 QI:0/-1/0/0/-1/1/1/0/334
MKLVSFRKKTNEEEIPKIRWISQEFRLNIIINDTKRATENSHIGFSEACRYRDNFKEIRFEEPYSKKPQIEKINSIIGRLQYFFSFNSVTFSRSVHPESIVRILTQLLKQNKGLNSVEISFLDINDISKMMLFQLINILKHNFSLEKVRIITLEEENFLSNSYSIANSKLYSQIYYYYKQINFPFTLIPKFRKLDNVLRIEYIRTLSLFNFDEDSVIDHYCLHTISYLKNLDSFSGKWKIGVSRNRKAIEYSVAKLIYTCNKLNTVTLQYERSGPIPDLKSAILLKAIFDTVKKSFSIYTVNNILKWTSVDLQSKDPYISLSKRLENLFLWTRR